jgi:dihydroorotase
MNSTEHQQQVSRRSFLERSVASLASLAPANNRLFAAAAEKPFDLLVTGGTVIDPYHTTKRALNIGLKHGKIVQVAEKLDAAQAVQVLDVNGLYVSPGWIDLHAHFFNMGVDADRDVGVYAGVTTAVDPGGPRASDFADFRRVVEKSATRLLI